MLPDWNSPSSPSKKSNARSSLFSAWMSSLRHASQRHRFRTGLLEKREVRQHDPDEQSQDGCFLRWCHSVREFRWIYRDGQDSTGAFTWLMHTDTQVLRLPVCHMTFRCLNVAKSCANHTASCRQGKTFCGTATPACWKVLARRQDSSWPTVGWCRAEVGRTAIYDGRINLVWIWIPLFLVTSTSSTSFGQIHQSW